VESTESFHLVNGEEIWSLGELLAARHVWSTKKRKILLSLTGSKRDLDRVLKVKIYPTLREGNSRRERERERRVLKQ